MIQSQRTGAGVRRLAPNPQNCGSQGLSIALARSHNENSVCEQQGLLIGTLAYGIALLELDNGGAAIDHVNALHTLGLDQLALLALDHDAPVRLVVFPVRSSIASRL